MPYISDCRRLVAAEARAVRYPAEWESRSCTFLENPGTRRRKLTDRGRQPVHTSSVRSYSAGPDPLNGAQRLKRAPVG